MKPEQRSPEKKFQVTPRQFSSLVGSLKVVCHQTVLCEQQFFNSHLGGAKVVNLETLTEEWAVRSMHRLQKTRARWYRLSALVKIPHSGRVRPIQEEAASPQFLTEIL